MLICTYVNIVFVIKELAGLGTSSPVRGNEGWITNQTGIY